MSRPRFLSSLIALLLLPLAALAQGEPGSQPLAAALKSAAEKHQPVLVDFHAPWCYSCYYMKKNVLNGPQWDQVERSAVVLELDADAPEGAYWKDQWKVKALPSYVVLNEQGEELGRILAEQTREDFYRQLAAIFARGSTLAALQAKVKAGGGKAAIEAAREVLGTYHARGDAEAGLAWFKALARPAADAVAGDAQVALWLQRLQLQRAVAAKDVPAGTAAAAKVLAGDLGCERAYELDKLLVLSESLPQAGKTALLSAQRPALEQLVNQRVFGAGPACADERSAVFAAADLYQALGDRQAESAVLDRAIAQVEKKLAGDYRKDRNLTDNLRVYLDRAGKVDQLDQLYPKLIAAWPEDYVYAFRYGKSLLARGKAAEALPPLEQAAPLAYGINRIRVAEQRVTALKALKRDAEAKKVVAETLRANGPWFPEDAAKLKALL